MSMQENPVYVAGLERSGTSLIYALLASHPRLAMSRRTNLWTHFYNQYGDLGRPDNLERCLAMMMRYKRILKLNPDPEKLRRDFAQGEPTYGRLFALVEEQYATQLGKTRWGDKSLHTERYAQPIFAAYPQARIIHMIRDPRDRYASSATRWKVKRGGIGAGTAIWLDSYQLARQNCRLYPERYLILRYETLASRPEETLQHVCAFIGEEYTPDMLSMTGAKTFLDKGGNSSYGERRPGVISTSSIGKYRHVLTKQEIAFVQTHAGTEMLESDYLLDTVDFALSDRLRYALVGHPLNVTRMVAWRMVNAVQNRRGRPVPRYRLVPDVAPTA